MTIGRLTRRMCGVVLAVLVCGVAAAPAEASGWRWLEKLSGPGHFVGLQLDMKILCEYESKPAQSQATEGIRVVHVSAPCIKKRNEKGVPTDAINLDLTRRRYAAGVSVGYLQSLDNDLSYAVTPEPVDTGVKVATFEGFYDRKFPNSYRAEYGIAVGGNLFVVPAAENFWRMSVEPRVTFKLLDLSRGGEYKGTFNVRLGLLWFPGGFKDTDFGALPGTYDSGVELGPSIRFIFDFDANPFKRARTQ